MGYCSVLFESVEHADDIVVHFGKKVCFENWKQCVGNLRILYNKTNREGLTVLFSVVKHSGGG